MLVGGFAGGLASNIKVGTAGWSIPAAQAAAFGLGSSHLNRYAARLNGVEINTSFYRAHRPSTYSRWAASVPASFQFAVKVPRSITHERRLRDSAEVVESFLSECGTLGTALGPLLLQLPPSLKFDITIVEAFLISLRDRFSGAVVCEPRHGSWFCAEVDALLATYQVGRVAADPAVVPEAAEPGGWSGLVYYRLHGSPRVYYSAYGEAILAGLAQTLREAAQRGPAWCIFDNTAAGEAAANALQLLPYLQP